MARVPALQTILLGGDEDEGLADTATKEVMAATCLTCFTNALLISQRLNVLPS